MVRTYLARVARTVALLGRYHVYTLLDMHQDLYSSAFGGEGAPPWAVCTDGLRIVRPPGRWSRTYSTSTLDIAEAHFWTNDVVGNLQGDYLEAWRAVAQYFAKNPWVVGYDMINEPYTLRLSPGDPEVATQLECFYTGRGQPGLDQAFGLRLLCPPSVPREGLVPTLQSASPHRLLFFEPDIYGRKHVRNTVGPIDDPNLVYNFHSYCPFRDPVTGNPTNVGGCADRQISTIRRRQADRATDFTSAQPRGPAWFMSEFGATDNGDLVAALVAAADRYQLGWSSGHGSTTGTRPAARRRACRTDRPLLPCGLRIGRGLPRGGGRRAALLWLRPVDELLLARVHAGADPGADPRRGSDEGALPTAATAPRRPAVGSSRDETPPGSLWPTGRAAGCPSRSSPDRAPVTAPRDQSPTRGRRTSPV